VEHARISGAYTAKLRRYSTTPDIVQWRHLLAAIAVFETVHPRCEEPGWCKVTRMQTRILTARLGILEGYSRRADDKHGGQKYLLLNSPMCSPFISTISTTAKLTVTHLDTLSNGRQGRLSQPAISRLLGGGSVIACRALMPRTRGSYPWQDRAMGFV
jgi:hypothetical protein